jgi:DNA repair protein RadC
MGPGGSPGDVASPTGGGLSEKSSRRLTSVRSRAAPLGYRGLFDGGGDGLSDADLLAVLLGSRNETDPAAALARGALASAGGLRPLGRAGVAELLRIRGMSARRVMALRAFYALSRRLLAEGLKPGVQFRTSEDIYRHFACRLRDAKKEQFLTVLLDGKNRVIREEKVSEGSLTASIVHPREVFMPAIRESAGAIVLVHNHPSGDPTPSFEDIEVTERLLKVGEVVGIRILDHVIVGEGAFTSFVDRGLIPGVRG